MGLLDESKNTCNTVKDDKITERLIKFYKDKMRVIGLRMKNNDYSADDLDSIVNYLLSKGKNLSDNKQIADILGISQHDAIYCFIQTCLESHNFSPETIKKFIIEHSSIFIDLPKKEYKIDIEYKKYCTEKIAFNKSESVMKFLLFVVDISRDEDYCNPKQILTIDYILALAKNITDVEYRRKFKMLALSYFLPETHEEIQSNLNKIWQDIQKLFSDELSIAKNATKKFDIKIDMLDMLTAKKNSMREDAARLKIFSTPHYNWKTNFISNGYCLEDPNFIDCILNFFEDDIKTFIGLRGFFFDYGLLLMEIRNLFSDKVLSNKICELMEKNKDGKNGNKIFVLFFALLQNGNSNRFAILNPYVETKNGLEINQTLRELITKIPVKTKFKLLGFYVTQHKKNKKTDKLGDNNDQHLCDILFTDINEFIDQFCNYYADKKELGSEQHQCFLRGTAMHLLKNYLKAGKNLEERKSFILNLQNKITYLLINQSQKLSNDMQIFLHELMRCIIVSENCSNFLGDYEYMNEIPNNFVIGEDTTNVEAAINFLNSTLKIFEQNPNISKDFHNTISFSIQKLFFDDKNNLNRLLNQEKFINCLAQIVQNQKFAPFKIYMEGNYKYLLTYVKERLNEIKSNNYDNCLTQCIRSQNIDLEINNLRQTINFYKWLYLFALIPVLGWIFCAILYFCFHEPASNRLEQLTQDQQPRINDLDKSLTTQTNTFSRLNQLIRTQANSEKQSEQLQNDCQILLDFIDSKEQIPPENMIIGDKPKPLSEDNIISK